MVVTSKLLMMAALMGSAALAPQMALAEDSIKVGLLATLEGPFTVLGQDGVRGAELALTEAGYTAGGKKIVVIKGSSDASPDSAVKAARKLVEQDGVAILIGPLSGDEGLAVKDYAKTQPNVTFVNGTSAAQDTTLRDPAPNFFRFSTDGAQWMAGLGDYAFKVKKYKTVVTVAEDYSFPYSQVFGFMASFCNDGGHVPKKFWVPIGNKDFSSVIAAIPDNGRRDLCRARRRRWRQLPDAISASRRNGASDRRVDHRRSDGARHAGQAARLCRRARPLGRPDRRQFGRAGVEEIRRRLQVRLQGWLPVAFAVRAGLLHQHQGGIAGARQGRRRPLRQARSKFRDVLSHLEFDTPTGMVKLDKNRQAIADNYLTEVAKADDGTPLQQGHRGGERPSTRRSAFRRPISSNSASPTATTPTASERVVFRAPARPPF